MAGIRDPGLTEHRPGIPGIPAAASVAVAVGYAGTGRRFAAFAIDAALLVLTELLWLEAAAAPIAALGVGERYDALVAEAVVISAYFAIAWSMGRSIGMRILGIRLERLEGGGPPGRQRGLIRAALGVPPLLALFVLLELGFSDEPDAGYSTLDAVLLLGAIPVFALGLAARLTMIRHPRHQSHVDRAAGVVVLRGAPAMVNGTGASTQLVLPGIPSTEIRPLAPPQFHFAPTGTRFAAFFFDLIFVTLTIPIWVMVIGGPFYVLAFGEVVSAALGVVVGWAGYFAFSWARGRSLGMRLLSIHLERADGGGNPGFRRGLVRGLLVSTPISGSLAVFVVWFDRLNQCVGDNGACRRGDDFPLYMAGFTLLGIGLVSRLTMIRHPRHQSAVDRAAGVVVVYDPQEEPPADGASPAGE